MRKATIKILRPAAKIAYAQSDANMTFKNYFRDIKKNYRAASSIGKRKAKLGALEIWQKWMEQKPKRKG